MTNLAFIVFFFPFSKDLRADRGAIFRYHLRWGARFITELRQFLLVVFLPSPQDPAGISTATRIFAASYAREPSEHTEYLGRTRLLSKSLILLLFWKGSQNSLPSAVPSHCTWGGTSLQSTGCIWRLLVLPDHFQAHFISVNAGVLLRRRLSETQLTGA